MNDKGYDRPLVVDAAAMAEDAIRASGGSAHVHFKFYCSTCGEDCIFLDKNTYWEFGECHACSALTRIVRLGILFVAEIGDSSATPPCCHPDLEAWSRGIGGKVDA